MVVRRCERLRHLSVLHNHHITSLPNLPSSLQSLSLQHCACISDQCLHLLCSNCPQLSRLRVTNCALTALPPQLMSLNKCQSLKVDKYLVDKLISERLSQSKEHARKYWKALKNIFSNNLATGNVVLNHRLLNSFFPEFDLHNR